MRRVVSCLTWDRAARKRLIRLAAHPVRIKQLPLHLFVIPIFDNKKKCLDD